MLGLNEQVLFGRKLHVKQCVDMHDLGDIHTHCMIPYIKIKIKLLHDLVQNLQMVEARIPQTDNSPRVS